MGVCGDGGDGGEGVQILISEVVQGLGFKV